MIVLLHTGAIMCDKELYHWVLSDTAEKHKKDSLSLNQYKVIVRVSVV